MTTFAIRGHKATKTAHVVWVIDNKPETQALCSNYDRGQVRTGRTDLGAVEDYEGIVADAGRIATEQGYSICVACVADANKRVVEHAEHRAQVVREGATAGRTLRYSLTFDRQIPEEATLHSIEDARESFEHELADLIARHPHMVFAVEFADS